MPIGIGAAKAILHGGHREGSKSLRFKVLDLRLVQKERASYPLLGKMLPLESPRTYL